jgi:sec-independent protein translocase protein TatC
MATGLLCFPLFGLYEAGIFLTSIFGKKKKLKEAEDTSDADKIEEEMSGPDRDHD